ncbi:hypothetical protein SY83_02440 [Paenibacillus swuensis]|uniref:RNA polymerase sigma-54 factor n=1 Tax=Paenibacillus swuensis TaxID=1178515 RepID=A0A172TEA5_9BACL|nr:RNA polymerase factor sigma-54 [Paenibacillus swuensis]ANE45371.1 hypothetical protein SY83_02440 [Paenibacillus swuensis]
MQAGAGLQLEQGLKLSITPEMHQSIHMLQLSNSELSDYLYEQANDNPLLNVQEPKHRSIFLKQNRKKSPSATQVKPDVMHRIPAYEHTLEDSLVSQLRMSHLPQEVFRAAVYMAGNLDDSGYLDVTTEQVAVALSMDSEMVEEALRQVHRLEPAGVGARDVSECLRIQLEWKAVVPVGAREIVCGYLTLLAQGRLDRIAAELGISLDQVKEAVAMIRKLDPRPGLALTPQRNVYVVPDARIEVQGEEITILLLKGSLPKVTINTEYASMAEQIRCQPTVTYLKEMTRAASVVLRSMEHREETLYRVIQAIMQEQEGFVTGGVEGLKPLKLKQIAEQLGLHESTVSRAVMNKFVETPRGVVPLKFFFSSGLQTSGGEAASSVTVKAKIRQLIDTENKIKPFSDQKIVDVLDRDGIQLSRRTVTKYREEMHILSSVLRKTM